jgi:hypothetical protein
MEHREINVRAATRVGGLVLLVAAVLAVVLFLVRAPASVKYAGGSGGVSATVSLRLPGGPAPSQVTVDLGNGVRVVAARLP